MAFEKKPTAWLGAEYAATNEEMAIPLASLPELTAGEADENTGDIRKILYALCVAMREKFASLPAGDRPAKMTISETQGALNGNTVQVGFNFNFTLAVSAMDVANES